jgi:hypothetical protein
MDAYLVYVSIARTGVWLTPILAFLIAALGSKVKHWSAPVISVALCPLFFALIFKTYSVVYDLQSAIPSSGDFTTTAAAHQFYAYCLSLCGWGLVIGGIASAAIWFFGRDKR